MKYGTIALDFTITGKVPGEITNQIPSPLPFATPPCVHVLRRCTLHLADPSQNHRLANLAVVYDILALRPFNERSLLQACQSLDCDIISLDLGTRFPFHFKHTTLASALQRGIKFEICYGPGMLNTDGGSSRRNLISNATQLIRATRGKGIILSSEAKHALACRAPADVVNMAVLWGLGQEKGMEAVGREARSVVVQAEMKRRSFRGVVDVIYGGEKPEKAPTRSNGIKGKQREGKRKASATEAQDTEGIISTQPISKREQKRQAKRAKHEQAKTQQSVEDPTGVSAPNSSTTTLPPVTQTG